MGVFVEIEGRIDAANEVFATEIELEDEFDDDNQDEVSITGFVQRFVGIDEFYLGSQRVDASGAVFENGNSSQLADGVRVEVEGEIIDGVLIADEVEFEERDVEISAALAEDVQPESGLLILLGIEVQVIASTLLEDKLSADEMLVLTDLVTGDFLEIRALVDGDGVLTASRIRRESTDDIELKGPVEAFNKETGEIVILGQTISILDEMTAFRIDEADASRSEFFEKLEVGDFVEVEDKEDGDEANIDFATEVELEGN